METGKGQNLKKFAVVVGAVAVGVVIGQLLYNDVVKRFVFKK